MAQFSVHKNTHSESRKSAPYLLDIQHPLLSSLNSRIVIPLLAAPKDQRVIAKLNPMCEVDGKHFVIKTQNLAVVPPSQLGTKVMDLSERRYEIIAAIDMLVSGI